MTNLISIPGTLAVTTIIAGLVLVGGTKLVYPHQATNINGYPALMKAPQGWEPVVGASESISLLYRVDGTLKRLDGKKPFKKQGFRTTECRLPDCDGKHFGRGFCRKHYNRLKKHGSPRIVQPPGRAPRKCLQCEERVHAHGLCNRHYLMMRRAIKAAANQSNGVKSGSAKREAKRWEWADRKLAEAAL